ncbi:MAG TPA: isoprenylcysteine carboxylmethyltransferase family protein [Kofleriaceae bacterium]|jgi:protein-S-isoprenylcysteine O-methyltransferase Ste14|nr:isoprenylcysteine carboxylmethyltransferase family protein [Kofleriaceae bacterium]
MSGYAIGACWAVFASYWLVSALRVKAVSQRESFARTLTHRSLLALGYALLVERWLPAPFDLRWLPDLTAVRIAGDVVCAVGLVIAIAARRALAGNWSSAVTLKQDHELIRAGAYRFVRHPIYTGMLTMFLGSAIEDGQLRGALAFALTLVAFLIKSRREELLLAQHFPDEYPAYKRDVKALIPFVL